MKSGNKCSVCIHPAVEKVNEFLRNKTIQIEGRNYTTATALVEWINKKYPDNQLGNHNISRHKASGHVPGATSSRPKGVHVIYDNGKLYEAGEDSKEITRFNAREALEIVLSVGAHLIMKGVITVRAQDTIEAAKKLAELDKGAENANEWEQHMAEFLRKSSTNVIEGEVREALPPGAETQDYLNQVVVVPPEHFVQGLKQPTYNPADDIIERSEDDEYDRDYS